MEQGKKGYQLGILGGMGPLATATLFEKIVLRTKASCDQDHIQMVVLDKASIPDRTRAILYNEPSPLPKLNEGIEELISLDCKYFIMPCNTAHAFSKDFKNLDKIEFINMIEETKKKLSKSNQTFYVFCTDGTREVNVYDAPFLKYPDKDTQKKVMDIITRTKAGSDEFENLVKLIKEFNNNVLLACTELSIYFDKIYKMDRSGKEFKNILIEDAMDILIDSVFDKLKKDQI